MTELTRHRMVRRLYDVFQLPEQTAFVFHLLPFDTRDDGKLELS